MHLENTSGLRVGDDSLAIASAELWIPNLYLYLLYNVQHVYVSHFVPV